ncbi:MAG TPA: AraC family transcriptional regulator, partial [Cytophagales bacterium]|nr:AraC family transcriptional regulator [Cytophagales bacterium]
KDKLYKTEGLSIKELAEKSGFQSYLVSQAINSVLNKTFFELVNEYRIEESKRLLTNPAYNHLSLVGIGFEAGFNSKTTFNSLFKKHTGFTPSEYKKNHSANTSQISRSTATSSFKI